MPLAAQPTLPTVSEAARALGIALTLTGRTAALTLRPALSLAIFHHIASAMVVTFAVTTFC
jgi:hypothetical protein